jgi:hypothetical protein
MALNTGMPDEPSRIDKKWVPADGCDNGRESGWTSRSIVTQRVAGAPSLVLQRNGCGAQAGATRVREYWRGALRDGGR